MFSKKSYSSLLKRVSEGNTDAFSKLYDLFYPSLLKHVKSKVGEESMAQDILHDLFLSLWRTRGRITEIDSLPAYLYASCRYLIINHFKKSAGKINLENVERLDIPNNDESIDERLHYRYLLDQVNKEIDRLPEKCRAIFKLSREEYKSNREIAEYLNISESTVENQIRKALQRIKLATRTMNLFFFLTIFLFILSLTGITLTHPR